MLPAFLSHGQISPVGECRRSRYQLSYVYRNLAKGRYRTHQLHPVSPCQRLIPSLVVRGNLVGLDSPFPRERIAANYSTSNEIFVGPAVIAGITFSPKLTKVFGIRAALA